MLQFRICASNVFKSVSVFVQIHSKFVPNIKLGSHVFPNASLSPVYQNKREIVLRMLSGGSPFQRQKPFLSAWSRPVVFS